MSASPPPVSLSLWHGEQYTTQTGASSSKQSKESQRQKSSSFDVPRLDNSFSVPATISWQDEAPPVPQKLGFEPLKTSSSNVGFNGEKCAPQTNRKQKDADRYFAFGSSSINVSSDTVSGANDRTKHQSIAETAVSLGAAVQKKSDHKQRASSENVGVEKPKRPLSAYNYFFQHERARLLLLSEQDESLKDNPPVALKARDVRNLLRNNPHVTDRAKRPHRKSHGKVSFTDLVKVMAKGWKNVDDQTRAVFEEIAYDDKARYRKQMRAYRAKLNALKTVKKRAASSPSGCFNVSPTASDAAVEPTAPKKLKTEEYPCYATRECSPGNPTPRKSGKKMLKTVLDKKDTLKDELVVGNLPARSFSLCNTAKKIAEEHGNGDGNSNGIVEVGTMIDEWKTEKETTTVNFAGVIRNVSPSVSPPLGFDSELLGFLKELDWTRS